METVDPFYDPIEEAQAKAQSARNSITRNLLKERASLPIAVAEDHAETTTEFIRVNEGKNAEKEASSCGEVPWMPPSGYPPFGNMFLRLHQEMLDFARWVSLSAKEQETRELFINRLNSVCKSLWPGCKVVPFGSYLTGLSLPSSDVDVSVIRVPAESDGLGEIGCLRRLANALLEQKQVSFIELRETAKVPILRIKDRDAPFVEIDISLNSEAPQATSKFIIRNAISAYPQFRPLVLLIKCFLYQRNLADTFTGGVGSYLLSCLVLGFLQNHAVSNPVSRMSELTSLGHLLFDFFSFYAKELRAEREGLSLIRGGSRFLKTSRRFDPSTSSLTNRRALPFGEALCVESPLEPWLDIGNKVFQWKVIKSAFMQARQMLVDEIQNFDPDNAMKSLLAPAMVFPSHPMFSRWTSEGSAQNCPLSSLSKVLEFSERLHATPPSPYSEQEVEIHDSEDDHDRHDSRKRRHSDEPPRTEYREQHNRRYHEADYQAPRDRFYTRKF